MATNIQNGLHKLIFEQTIGWISFQWTPIWTLCFQKVLFRKSLTLNLLRHITQIRKKPLFTDVMTSSYIYRIIYLFILNSYILKKSMYINRKTIGLTWHCSVSLASEYGWDGYHTHTSLIPRAHFSGFRYGWKWESIFQVTCMMIFEKIWK
jgi:hypothetical protein